MSISITIDIHCDRCHDWSGPANGFDHVRTVREARAAARRCGWIRTRATVEPFSDEKLRLLDLCPRCQ